MSSGTDSRKRLEEEDAEEAEEEEGGFGRPRR